VDEDILGKVGSVNPSKVVAICRNYYIKYRSFRIRESDYVLLDVWLFVSVFVSNYLTSKLPIKSLGKFYQF